MKLQLSVEFEREAPGRWLAEVVDLPGVMAYGATKADAFRKVQALALEVIADRLKQREDPLTGRPKRTRTVSAIGFAYAHAS